MAAGVVGVPAGGIAVAAGAAVARRGRATRRRGQRDHENPRSGEGAAGSGQEWWFPHEDLPATGESTALPQHDIPHTSGFCLAGALAGVSLHSRIGTFVRN